MRRLRRVKGAFTLAGGIITALLSYWLGYEHGSFERPPLNEPVASATPVPQRIKLASGLPEGEPAIRYGESPERSEPSARPAEKF